MKNFKACGFAAGLGCVAILAGNVFAITANPNLSMGKNLYVDDALNSNWKPEVYTDGHLDFNQVASATKLALNIGEGPTKIFITWETRGDEAWVGDQYVHAASCQHNPKASASLQNFKILTSGNSTDGVDGDWEVAAEVGESGAMSRGLSIDFAGKSWFKIVAESAVVNLEEIGAYDMSNGGDDTWFFMGTSISQMGMKSIEVDSNFAQLIHARYPDYYPAMLRGGIGCVTSSGVVDGLSSYNEYVSNVKYWAIEMGTNDAWGGYDTNVETFRSNMQDIIDVAKRKGVTPIIARMIATNPEVAGWQVHENYLKAIDELTVANNLPKGPDFYGYFLEHPEELSTTDGVHPAEKGAQSMHRLWAEAVASLYENNDSAGNGDAGTGDNGSGEIGGNDSNEGGDGILQKSAGLKFAMPRVSVEHQTIQVTGLRENAQVTVMDLMGHTIESLNASGSVRLANKYTSGNYLVVVRGNGIAYSSMITVK